MMSSEGVSSVKSHLVKNFVSLGRWEKLPPTSKAKRIGGLWAISFQAGKLPERKDTPRKPLLPHLRYLMVCFGF